MDSFGSDIVRAPGHLKFRMYCCFGLRSIGKELGCFVCYPPVSAAPVVPAPSWPTVKAIQNTFSPGSHFASCACSRCTDDLKPY